MTISEWRLKMSDNGVASKLQQIGGAADAASSRMGGLQNKLMSIKGAIGAAFGVTAIAAFGKQIIDTGSQFEQLQISYDTMLGSHAAGMKMMADTKKFAAETPFELPEVAQASKQLLAFGIEQDKIRTSLKAVGDVASGISAPLGDIAYLYGTIKTQGKAMTMDIRQFANRGIPIYAELAKITGKSGMALNKFVEDGRVGFPLIEQAFANMSGAGGKFYNLMEKQSHSIGGQISNLADKFTYLKNELFENLKPAIKGGIEWLNGLMVSINQGTQFVIHHANAFKTAAVVIGTLFTGYKLLKVLGLASSVSTLLLTTRIAAQATTAGYATTAMLGYTTTTTAATVAQKGLNAAMALNPYGAALIALTAMVGAMESLKQMQDDIAEAAVRAAGKGVSTDFGNYKEAWAQRGVKNDKAQNMLAYNTEEAHIEKRIAAARRQMEILKEAQRTSIKDDWGARQGRIDNFNQVTLQPAIAAMAALRKNRSLFLSRGIKTDPSKTDPAKNTIDTATEEINGGGKSIHNLTININKDGITQEFKFASGGYKENESDIERASKAMLLRVINSGAAAYANR